jgi:hypothetical protein
MKWSCALVALFVLTGCGTERSEDVAANEIVMPSDATLPVRFDQGCDCVENGRCPIADERLGEIEVRNTVCRPTGNSDEASCRYESRFVAEFPAEDGTRRLVPEDWRENEMIVRHLGGDAWCQPNFES